MQICVLVILLPVVSGLLFDLFKLKKKCESPFRKSPDDPNLKNIWNGFFRCPYEPSANPNIIVDDFVQFYYIQSGQESYSVGSVSEIISLVNPSYSNFIILHGFNDGVRFDGMYFNHLIFS